MAAAAPTRWPGPRGGDRSAARAAAQGGAPRGPSPHGWSPSAPAGGSCSSSLRLDYCCGGRQILAAACTKHGLELDEVLAALRALDERGLQAAGVEGRDWREVGTAELCAHIVTVHHDGLRESFPRIDRLLATVVRVHGDRAPRLRDAQRRFSEIRGELEPHLATEESELFPACIASDRTGTPVAELLLEQHEAEHAALGHALGALRILCVDYDRRAALCNTHRALLDALAAFEQDLHQHVHEENNILLARARRARSTRAVEARSSAPLDRPTAASPSQAFPPCCVGWIAEQTHGWAAQQRGR
jgi:regulator of cell morphogenesis and NO signaling